MPDFGALEQTVLPNGAEVYYRDSDHSYWREVAERKGEWGGKGRLTGISTVSSPFDFRPDALLRWAARLNGEGIAILAADALSQDDADDMRSGLRWLDSADSIWRALTDASLTFEDIRDQAATRGTNVHQHALHELAVGKPVPDLAAMTEEERGYAHGVVEFWLAHDPEPLQAEQVVADLDLGVAGRFDLRANIGGKTVLVDCKTSGFIPTKHHAQIAGYEHCCRVSGFGASDSQLILQVNEQGDYVLLPIQATAEDFAFGVEVYRRAGRINRDAKRVRDGQLPVAA